MEKLTIIRNGKEIIIDDTVLDKISEMIGEQPGRAKKGETFYYIGKNGDKGSYEEDGDDFDDEMYEYGNYYLTEEARDAALELRLHIVKLNHKYGMIKEGDDYAEYNLDGFITTGVEDPCIIINQKLSGTVMYQYTTKEEQNERVRLLKNFYNTNCK